MDSMRYLSPIHGTHFPEEARCIKHSLVYRAPGLLGIYLSTGMVLPFGPSELSRLESRGPKWHG